MISYSNDSVSSVKLYLDYHYNLIMSSISTITNRSEYYTILKRQRHPTYEEKKPGPVMSAIKFNLWLSYTYKTLMK